MSQKDLEQALLEQLIQLKKEFPFLRDNEFLRFLDADIKKLIREGILSWKDKETKYDTKKDLALNALVGTIKANIDHYSLIQKEGNKNFLDSLKSIFPNAGFSDLQRYLDQNAAELEEKTDPQQVLPLEAENSNREAIQKIHTIIKAKIEQHIIYKKDMKKLYRLVQGFKLDQGDNGALKDFYQEYGGKFITEASFKFSKFSNEDLLDAFNYAIEIFLVDYILKEKIRTDQERIIGLNANSIYPLIKTIGNNYLFKRSKEGQIEIPTSPDDLIGARNGVELNGQDNGKNEDQKEPTNPGLSKIPYSKSPELNFELGNRMEEEEYQELYEELLELGLTGPNKDRINQVLKMLSKIGERCKDILISFYVYQWRISEIRAYFGYKTDQVVIQTKKRCLIRIKEML